MIGVCRDPARSSYNQEAAWLHLAFILLHGSSFVSCRCIYQRQKQRHENSYLAIYMVLDRKCRIKCERDNWHLQKTGLGGSQQPGAGGGCVQLGGQCGQAWCDAHREYGGLLDDLFSVLNVVFSTGLLHLHPTNNCFGRFYG